ncbi:MAG: hypothetical protein AB7O43_05160 [Hyphomicrobiaceae bacterium]
MPIATEPSTPVVATAAAAANNEIYGAGGLRKTLVALAFLLLLPFFVSLPIMIGQRLLAGVLLDTWGLILIGIGFAIIMALLLFELMFSLRASVEIGKTGFRYTLPSARSMILPMLSYRHATVPYDQVELVETRREIYGGTMAPVMLRGARVITKEGQTHTLGYVSEAEVDPLIPVPDIAAKIAARAGVEMVDRGSVWRIATNKMLGIKAIEGTVPITDEDIVRLNRRHRLNFMLLLGAMVLLMIGGIGLDFSTGTKDRGELARDAVQRSSMTR